MHGIRKKYDAPPVDAVELVLRCRVSEAHVRQLLYYPTDEDMKVYPRLMMSPPPGAPKV